MNEVKTEFQILILRHFQAEKAEDKIAKCTLTLLFLPS